MTNGSTPLIVACGEGRTEVIKVLLDKSRATINLGLPHGVALMRKVIMRSAIYLGFVGFFGVLVRLRFSRMFWLIYAACC